MSDFGEPWKATSDWFGEERPDGGCNPVGYVFRPSLPEESEHGREWIARQDRVVACVNALAGIADPAAFVERAKATEVLLRRAKAIGIEPAETILFALSVETAALAAEWTPDA